MSRKAFEKIAEGLTEAVDLAKAEALTGIPAATLQGLRAGKLVAVPVYPTLAMKEAGSQRLWEPSHDIARYVWEGMIAAAKAPTP